ncbi:MULTISPECIES: prepilin peptidase-dependent protein [unclassified Enterobacter]|uniref:prepilin peptidase-dependent protein n=1 Tax=unclassified Enterobacter TaxID=2608935 RepID=UPI0003ED17A6|nr:MULTISPECIES: prepilin peptidase-dependent protein [unclassified Enterobacter]EWG72944.1 Prepilin peptidase-dependent protein A precursor [Enterobacter sp. DC4]EWG73975.1 Prepilin peptidase-dependent protein A precursor [Enterobacter sp. DC3]
MKKENGFTFIETLVAVSLVVILSASGLYGWDSWQRQQRLWQTASQVRDYLLFLRNHANRHNSDHLITLQRVGGGDCLVSSAVQGCKKESPFVLIPPWPEVEVREVTPSLGFYGLRDTAWAGRIRVQSRAGAWLIIVSNGGRIRMCQVSEGGSC